MNAKPDAPKPAAAKPDAAKSVAAKPVAAKPAASKPAASKPAAAKPGAVSAWAPMAIPAFRVLWFAQLGSNIGTWMQTVGAQWYLVEAAAGATIIALVQTASLAPAVLFSLPAGVLADSLDRRRLLIWGSAASAVIAAVLTVIAALNDLTPWTILGFTFLLGITSTLTSPAWQAIQPELVPRPLIGASSALGGVTVNGARAVGPALAGVHARPCSGPRSSSASTRSASSAPSSPCWWWRRPPQVGLDDREPFGAALRAGVRYVASAHLVRRILLRSALFALPASALWALLPVTATRLGLSSSGYGLLLGAVGVGAVLGIFVLPSLGRGSRTTRSSRSALCCSPSALSPRRSCRFVADAGAARARRGGVDRHADGAERRAAADAPAVGAVARRVDLHPRLHGDDGRRLVRLGRRGRSRRHADLAGAQPRRCSSSSPRA